MTDDIVTRLRDPSALDGLFSLCREAAAEIERLRTARENDESFQAWVWRGLDQGWAKQFCAQHDALPIISINESRAIEEGDDPCLPALRIMYAPRDGSL
jgi:hypothetical protein